MIEQVLILTLTSIAICATTWEGMIFEKWPFFVGETLGEWLAKPLGGCYICTTFWVSLVGALALDWNPLLAFPAMGLSATISLFQRD